MLDNFLNSVFNRFPFLGISLAEVEDICVIGKVVEDDAEYKVIKVKNSLLCIIHDYCYLSGITPGLHNDF